MHQRKSDPPAHDDRNEDILSRLGTYLGFRTTHRKPNSHAEQPVAKLRRDAERKARRRRNRHHRRQRHHKELDHGVLPSDAPVITNEADLAPSMRRTVETFIERKRAPAERHAEKRAAPSGAGLWRKIRGMMASPALLFARKARPQEAKTEEIRPEPKSDVQDSFLARVDMNAQKAQEMAESIQQMESVINKKARMKEQLEKQLETLNGMGLTAGPQVPAAPLKKELEEVHAQKNMLLSLLETLNNLIRRLPKNFGASTKKDAVTPAPAAKATPATEAKQSPTSNLRTSMEELSSTITAAAQEQKPEEPKKEAPAQPAGRFMPLTPKMAMEEKKEESPVQKGEPKQQTPTPPAAQPVATTKPQPAAMTDTTDDKTLVVEGRDAKKPAQVSPDAKKDVTPVAFEPSGVGKIIPLSKAAQELASFSKVVVKTGAAQEGEQKKDALEEGLLKKVDKKSPMNQDLGDLMRDLFKKAEAKPGEEDKKKEEPVVVEEVDTKIGQLAMLRVRHKNGFTEFMGALKYFGMGKERYAIVQNLSTMLNAGLPLIDALHTLVAETRSKPAKKLIGRILEAVENGSPLWRAMDDQDFFTPHAIALIRIGEEAGDLAQNMEYLAAQQEKDNNLRQKVRMAMIYPAIVLALMFIIVIGLGMFVLPNLIQVLFSLNVKLPLVTRIVIAFTNAFTEHGAVGIPAFLVAVALITVLAKYTALRVVTQWVTFRIPGIGRLAREATVARFGVILGSLLQAGVPLVDSIKSLVEVTPTVAYRNFYKKLLDHISVGDSFAKSFATIPGSTAILPLSMQQLIITGERTGTLSKIMLKIAEIYEHQANDTAQKLPVILEPMLLLFIGSLVGTIAFSIIIPIYSIVGNVTGH